MCNLNGINKISEQKKKEEVRNCWKYNVSFA